MSVKNYSIEISCRTLLDNNSLVLSLSLSLSLLARNEEMKWLHCQELSIVWFWPVCLFGGLLLLTARRWNGESGVRESSESNGSERWPSGTRKQSYAGRDSLVVNESVSRGPIYFSRWNEPPPLSREGYILSSRWPAASLFLVVDTTPGERVTFLISNLWDFTARNAFFPRACLPVIITPRRKREA